MNTNPQDSLDNLSNLQVNRQQQLHAQVKQLFRKGLEKLQSPETREVGIAELKKLIQQYRQQEYLRGYIAILKTLKPNPNSGTKEHQILVISLLAQTYKQQLLDPIDKPLSLLKTSFRLVQILHGYFNDQSPTVQQACARALLDLNIHCIAEQTIETIFSIIFAPLISILKTGVDKGSQATASVCLSELINYNRRMGAQELLQRLSPEMLSVLLKINSDYHELFQAILGMIQSQGLNFLQGKLVSVLSKILSVINGTREIHSPNITNLNAYMCKVNVCKIIEKIAKFLPSTEKDKLIELRIPEALQQAARHRIIQVQIAAGKALKAWRGEETEDSPQKTRGLSSLEEKRNTKKLERSKSKEDRGKVENELTFMKEDLEKLVKGGWGANNRAKNYVKRGTGVGGGYIGRAEVSPKSRSKSGGKSHKEHFEQLRQFIKKGAQQNKHLERFTGIVGVEPQKLSQSPQPRSKSPPSRGKSPPSRGKSPSSRGKSPVRQQSRKKLAQLSGEEVGFVEDEGQQMVYEPQRQKGKPVSRGNELQNKSNLATSKNRFDDIGISEEEARELMLQENSLLQQGKNMNIDFTQVSEENKVIKKPSTRNHQGYQPYITPKQQVTNNKTGDFSTFKGLTQEELGELVQEQNLSQVSENLNDILNESDFKAFQTPQNDILDSRILEATKGKSQINVLKEIVTEKKERMAGVNKFLKKEPVKKPLQQKIPPVETPVKSPKKQYVDLHGQSLNFTQSMQSRAKSPPKREDIQFTLNPKEKFSMVKQEDSNEHEKQVQQQIAMSQYEESFPRDQPLPIILPKVAPITQIPLRHLLATSTMEKKEPQPESNVAFQRLIKNPPKIVGANEQSRIQKSKVSSIPQNSNQQQNQSVQEGIGSNWLNILNFVHQGQINEAYEAALSLDDPIYLLRLMLLSKLSLRELSAQMIQKLWRKFMQIYNQKFIDILTVSILTEGNELGLLSKCLSAQGLQDALMGLYELSGSSRGKLSYKAATLYNDIEKKLHPG